VRGADYSRFGLCAARIIRGADHAVRIVRGADYARFGLFAVRIVRVPDSARFYYAELGQSRTGRGETACVRTPLTLE